MGVLLVAGCAAAPIPQTGELTTFDGEIVELAPAVCADAGPSCTAPVVSAGVDRPLTLGGDALDVSVVSVPDVPLSLRTQPDGTRLVEPEKAVPGRYLVTFATDGRLGQVVVEIS